MRTNQDVEKTARALGHERWDIWTECGVHAWRALPRTESGDHFCPNCCTVWMAEGAITNILTKPATPYRA